MDTDIKRIRAHIQNFAFEDLFIEELGWDNYRDTLHVPVDDETYELTAIAEKRGMVAFACNTIPPENTIRRKIEKWIAKSHRENIIVYTDANQTEQVWQWVRREPGKPLANRERRFAKGQSGENIAQVLSAIAFSLDEEDDLTIVDVSSRVRAAFDVERVTKRFYDKFKKQHDAFLKFIDGIPDADLQRWYASVMMNRLMFIYFVQKKGLLDGNTDYLRDKLAISKGDFYNDFLKLLFFEGLAKQAESRSPEGRAKLGTIPYLNGGLFMPHTIEEQYGDAIQIPDEAFEKLFAFFDQYRWHLDDRPLRDDNEINPDVLGYIFEKYINQKQMGAYYTKEDITEYISKNTIIPFLFDEARKAVPIAFEGDHTVWELLQADPDRYIYPAVRHGTDLDLPETIAAGIDDVGARGDWNTPTPPEYGLPTEIWRETVTRRERYGDICAKIERGEVTGINDLITLNLDIQQFAQDVIDQTDSTDLIRAFWGAVNRVSVLDPTCGSGAFLFAALNILEPLYEVCLERMASFVADSPPTLNPSPTGGEGLEQTERWDISPETHRAMTEIARKLRREQTKSEEILWQALRGKKLDGRKFRRQQPVGAFVLDFYCSSERLAVEVDGAIHDFHQEADAQRQSMLESLGIRFVRVSATDVETNLPVVLDTIRDAFLPPTLNPSPTGGEGLGKTEQATTGGETFHNTEQHPSPRVGEGQGMGGNFQHKDFRETLARMNTHPNREYFILKSIVVNNLYGVDIMAEAVEIAKLRLFLKLVAQVDDSRRIEPLPDIDFNIRSGNTLVGFATQSEFAGRLFAQSVLPRIETLTNTVAMFRREQLAGNATSEQMATLKRKANDALAEIKDVLDQNLMEDYGQSDLPAFRRSHQPFHWFVEFYDVIRDGGFDVIIGNPPYVEYYKVRKEYQVRDYQTEKGGNLFAYTVERSLKLLDAASSQMGLIIPISGFSTDRMQPLQETVARSCSKAFMSHYSVRPAKLFEGAEQRLTILLGQLQASDSSCEFYTTKCYRWYNDERSNLLSLLRYTDIEANPQDTVFPKISIELEDAVLSKLPKTSLDKYFDKGSDNVVYWHRIPQYFIKGLNYVPYFWNSRDGVKKSEDYKLFGVANDTHKFAVMAALNSSLFYWYWFTVSDGYHCGKSDVLKFPMQIPDSDSQVFADIKMVIEKLMTDYQDNSVRRKRSQRTTDVEYDEFQPALSKPLMDEIDRVLARHYGFTDEELDFIINYDIKYRMGDDLFEEEDE